MYKISREQLREKKAQYHACFRKSMKGINIGMSQHYKKKTIFLYKITNHKTNPFIHLPWSPIKLICSNHTLKLKILYLHKNPQNTFITSPKNG